MSRGQTPRPRHDGPLLTEAGSLKPNGEAAAARILVATRRPGNPPGLTKPPSRGAWRCKRGRGRSPPGRAEGPQRWQARRAETVLAAAVGRPTRRSRRLGRQRKASQGTLAALAAAPPVSHSEGRIAHQHLATPRPPRGRASGPGARSIASRPGEPVARTRLRRDPSPDVRGPVVHQHPAPIEQVAAPVRGLDPIAVDVRKRQLAHLARRVGALRRPVPEA